MPDFLLELRSEEIPARMQAKASANLVQLFSERLAEAGLYTTGIEAYATPRRLALIARGLPEATTATSEELKGPRASAPPQALEGFLRKTGLSRDQIEERDGIFYAVSQKPGRPTAEVLAETVPAIVRAFPWPKSMRWGAASVSTDSLRWVRPLQGILALLGEDIVPLEIAGIRSGAATVGHRFHHPGPITIGSANDYVEKLRACHVILHPAERRRIIAEGSHRLAAEAGLILVEDEGLLAENAGLTEWPVPLLGSFDPAFLQVPPEVIQLTMRTNQKYFALRTNPPLQGEGDHPRASGDGGGVSTSPGEALPLRQRSALPPPLQGEDQGSLAPHFICTANIEASDGGEAIVRGNQKVLAARLADAKFFWEQDLKTPLEQQAEKLSQIVFHEKLGTLADKVDRVAKLARWLVEEGVVDSPLPRAGEERDLAAPPPSRSGEGNTPDNPSPSPATPSLPLPHAGEGLATLAERAARLCKADLVTSMVGEFPELQGVIGGHLARAQGEHPAVADAIRDHYKPVGQGDEVPTAPVTVAVSLADKLDTIAVLFANEKRPTGSKDPFALRRAAIGVISLIQAATLRLSLTDLIAQVIGDYDRTATVPPTDLSDRAWFKGMAQATDDDPLIMFSIVEVRQALLDFFADRLKVQQREAGVRHDLIDAVFALGGEDDLVRLLARVRALQSFVESPQGADLLAGYKRAANILKKEGYVIPAKAGTQDRGIGGASTTADIETLDPGFRRDDEKELSYTQLPEEAQLIAALDSAEPRARAAVADEDFEGAMAALASLRGPVDAFFDKVTVNDPDREKRDARLALLARMRDAVHQVADFSRIEG